MFKRTLLTGAVLSLGFVAAAQAEFKVMTVNGEKVSVQRQEEVYNNAVKAGAKAGPQLEDQVRRAITEETVLLQEAAKARIERTKEYRTAIDRAGKQLKVQLLVSEYAKKNPVSDKEAEARAAYDKARTAYGDTEYQVRHILVKTQDEATKLIERINKGEKFENLAKQYSIDPQSRDQGGLVGWLVPSNVDQAFGNAFKVLSAGSVAQAPILNQYGYHIVKLDAKRKAENFPTWESQKQSLKDQLSELKAKNHFAELVKKAKVNY